MRYCSAAIMPISARLRTTGLWLSLMAAMFTDVAEAAPKSLCVFDLLGANGPVYAQMRDYKIAAMAWGVDFSLKPYVDEKEAARDFKSGLCDAVSLTGTQSRKFNRFTGSLDAAGALSSYQQLKAVIASFSSEQAKSLLVSGPYEVVGIIPMGAVFLFVNDRALVARQVDKSGDLKQVRVAIMDDDPAQAELLGMIGTAVVESSISEMYDRFNRGKVDVTYGPAVVYEAMELYRGLQPRGGVIDFPVAQLTVQIMIRKERFSAQFAASSRQYVLSGFDQAIEKARNFERRIAPQWWLEISEQDQRRYHDMFRAARRSLVEKGVYSVKMLRLMRSVGCREHPQRNPCGADSTS